MSTGPDEDDMYRMVEDEFYTTAQRFTAHLHAVEYQRLKAEAKTQNAATINSISRPVVGRMTDLVKAKQDRAARRKRQKKKPAQDGATDSESDDDAYRGGSSLFGLMESPRKKMPRLDHFAPTVTSSRASAGFPHSLQASSRPTGVRPMRPVGQQPGGNSRQPARGSVEPSTDDGGDDLDAIPQRHLTPRPAKLPRTTAPEPRTPVFSVQERNTAQPSAVPGRRRSPRPVTESRGAPEQTDSSDDGSDGALFGFQKRARQRRTQPPGSTKSSAASSHDIIPGFT